ncbi:MAG: hypothetical protein WBQ78_05415 [Gammaproteobacteria bacterium]
MQQQFSKKPHIDRCVAGMQQSLNPLAMTGITNPVLVMAILDAFVSRCQLCPDLHSRIKSVQ